MLAQSVSVEIDAMDVVPIVQSSVVALDATQGKQVDLSLRTSMAGD